MTVAAVHPAAMTVAVPIPAFTVADLFNHARRVLLKLTHLTHGSARRGLSPQCGSNSQKTDFPNSHVHSLLK